MESSTEERSRRTTVEEKKEKASKKSKELISNLGLPWNVKIKEVKTVYDEGFQTTITLNVYNDWNDL